MARAAAPIIVQKYGGTSVGSAERMTDVANIVRSTLSSNRVIVVLSAMSSTKKTEGTTSRLLEAAKEVLKPNSQRYLEIIDIIERGHLRTVEEAVIKGPAYDAVVSDVKAECARLRSFMTAAEVIDEISPRSRDVMISTGEKLSARIFAALLQSVGVDAIYVSLDKLIEKDFDEKTIDQSFYDYITARLTEVLGSLADSQVPIVTGYLGPVPGSILTTIGRGYTDLTAALIAVGVKAQEVQIWKEVDGIFTADPRKAPKARLLPSISPEEAAELTYYGSEVIHPFTMEQLIRARIPIRIKNAFKPDGNGTVIVPDGWRPPQHAECLEDVSPRGTRTPKRDISSPFGSPPRHPQLSHAAAASYLGGTNGVTDGDASDSGTKRPTAVTIKDSVIVLNVHSNRKSVSHGFFAQIFLALDRHGIVVDLIATSEVHVSMALSPNVKEIKLEKALQELRKCGTVDVIRNMAILSLVGKQMRNMVGIAGLMFDTLARHNVNIEMISQGASEINISCVVEEERANDALTAIHDECILAHCFEEDKQAVS
ncbi:Aspartokinase [Geranomyces variabilis]|uniref:Aspartokinase n=1 Tax=Geranomyces variabilis TaxID=109894 RepID=A0AAD5TEP3_9FUNG|nr:Aspartokinase [Geranomyces variabilis]